MTRVDGQHKHGHRQLTSDVVIVGSGPAGSAVAKVAAATGLQVAVIEEGAWLTPQDFAEDGFTAMAKYYRDLGATIAMGNSPMPIVQGRAVGGTSVVNGAISWRLPHDVYDAWVAADPALANGIPWQELSLAMDQIERDLNILPTPTNIAGPNNLLLAKGAAALGLEHRPIARNVKNCLGLGRCLQGCPQGNKLSMDRTYLLDAEANGAVIYSNTTALKILHNGQRAEGVQTQTASGDCLVFKANKAVVVAASAVQSPVLLLKSGISHGPVGRHFQCHPGVSVAGRFATPVRMWEGATQGHEVIGLRKEGIKFEALGYDLAIVAMRLKGFGHQLADQIADLAHWANWGAAIKAQGQGQIKLGWAGRTRISYSITANDVAKFRRGIAVLAQMMLAAGAESINLGVHGWQEPVTSIAAVKNFAENGPLDPKSYMSATTHLFGTCRMGSNPATSVVRPDFRHHVISNLYVADSSVFPSNTGVNPQTAILAMALLCGRYVSA